MHLNHIASGIIFLTTVFLSMIDTNLFVDQHDSSTKWFDFFQLRLVFVYLKISRTDKLKILAKPIHSQTLAPEHAISYF